jgi:hypothetical protein
MGVVHVVGESMGNGGGTGKLRSLRAGASSFGGRLSGTIAGDGNCGGGVDADSAADDREDDDDEYESEGEGETRPPSVTRFGRCGGGDATGLFRGRSGGMGASTVGGGTGRLRRNGTGRASDCEEDFLCEYAGDR